MLHKISTPILVAIIIYHSYHYLISKRLAASVKAYDKEKIKRDAQPVKQARIPRINKITDRIYSAENFALANCIMLVGETGIVIIDTTESATATKKIYKEFRKVTDKPVKGIIYTHNHVDHVLGTRSFLDNQTDVEIWAHHTLPSIFFHSIGVVGQAHFLRSMRQFGVFIQDTIESSGIGFKLRVQDDKDVNMVPPNRYLYESQKRIRIAGIELDLIHIPGETDDQIAVFWPEEKALFCGDNFYKAFPNLYAIRGTPFRSLKLWKESLDRMRQLKPEILVPSHTDVVTGRENIYNMLTDYRDAIQLLHDQSVRFMNKEIHPDDIAQKIKLPDRLRNKPYLKELYGTVHWSVKNLIVGYMGWFNGDIAELTPHSPKEQAARLIKLAGGIDKVLIAAEESLQDNDPQWTLRLTTAVLRLQENSFKAKELKAKSLLDLAETQTSMNGINYYRSCAYETLGEIEIKLDAERKKGFIRNGKLKELFQLMALKLKADECSDIDQIVGFKFPDTQESEVFHLRNGVMDRSGEYVRKPDINVTVDSVAWRGILSGDTSGLLSAVTSKIVAEPSLASFQEVMNCFESS